MANLYIDETLTLAPETKAVTVRGEEARHAIKVARLRTGERILVSNGAGVTVTGVVSNVTNTEFDLTVDTIDRQHPPSVRLWLVQALAKGDRSERAVELATEFGVWGIVPWKAERSIVKWNAEKASKGVQKWQRVAREAAKQSMRAFIPIVGQPVTSTELISLVTQESSRAVVLHPRDASPLTSVATNVLTAEVTDVFVCVGPEGGVSEAELHRLMTAGLQTAVLGREILRTSSAGAAALAVFNTKLGRW